MSKIQKTLAVGASSLLAVGGVASVAVALPQADAATDAPQATEAVEVSTDSAVVYLDHVNGDFRFTQTEVASNDQIRKFIGDAAKYMCGNAAVNTDVDPKDWSITIGGDVQGEFTATYHELLHSEEVQKVIMGCTCKSNPSDGTASVNAEVKGLPFTTLLNMAQPNEGANTVVFTSADGYSIALPMKYVVNHGGLLVFDVNGAPIVDSIGGANQLWMGSTAANYFARDIDTITIETREEAPISPSSDEARAAYKNLPNVGILYGGEVR